MRDQIQYHYRIYFNCSLEENLWEMVRKLFYEISTEKMRYEQFYCEKSANWGHITNFIKEYGCKTYSLFQIMAIAYNFAEALNQAIDKHINKGT